MIPMIFRTSPHSPPRQRTRQRGQALVEFALVSPILLLILMAILDFALVILTYVQGVGAMREASRYAEVTGYASGPGGVPRFLDCAGMEAAAGRVLLAREQSVTIEYVKKDGTTYNCNTVTASALENGDMLRIRSSARIELITPLVTQFVPSLELNFRAQRTIVKSITLGLSYDIDSDFDGLPDEWELLHFGDLSRIATENLDGDLCNLGCEAGRGMNPFLDDTDGDGLLDHEEAYYYETDGTNPDTDGDGLNDYQEVRTLRDFSFTERDYDPANPDYDQRLCYSSPLLVDTDGDGLTDYEEVNATPPTNPCDPDTDNDGLSDLEDYERGTNGTLVDTDGDGLNDRDEIEIYGTDPLRPDTDGDGLNDGDEVFTVHEFPSNPTPGQRTCTTDPAKNDTDGDFIDDKTELLLGLNPCDSDWDNDGLLDGLEANYNTDPKKADTDNDGLLDGFEAFTNVYNPTTNISYGPCMLPGDMDGDTDNDGLSDGFEWTYGDLNVLNPCVEDTDGDGIMDGAQHGSTANNDEDGDGLRDSWEIAYFGSITAYGASDDPDGDGLSNLQEHPINTGSFYYPGTNPMRADTDNDGLNDYVEYQTMFDSNPNNDLNPNNPDSDGDGLFDGFDLRGIGETRIPAPYDGCQTNGARADTDGDGLSDYREVAANYESRDDMRIVWRATVNRASVQEVLILNPCSPDSDGDGLWDGINPATGFGEMGYVNPLYPDCVTHPLRIDTDGDGLSDYDEVVTHGTNPCNRDTDNDGLWDNVEIALRSTYPGLSPTKSDTDNDGLSDYDEHCDQPAGKMNPGECAAGMTAKNWDTSPINRDSDGDSTNGVDCSDGDELFKFTDPYKITNPSLKDTDEDGVNDCDELNAGTLPNNKILVTLKAPTGTLLEAEKSSDFSNVYTLTIELDKASPEATVLRYRTRQATALDPSLPSSVRPAAAGTDYGTVLASSAQYCETRGNGSNATTRCWDTNPITIPAGTRTATVRVFIMGDNSREGNEFFYVDLVSATNAKLHAPTAIAIIEDN
jgi:hypothetical protein